MDDILDWPVPAAGPDLPAEVVHLWRIPLVRERRTIEACARLLSAEDRERMQRFRFDVHRERFVLRRGALRTLLGHYLDVDPARVAFRYSAKGKPEVDQAASDSSGAARGAGPPISFNLSDSAEWALVGVTRQNRVGVDIEKMRAHADLDAIARDHFSPRELEELGSLAAADRIAGFYNAWTRKEAWLKACGDGLSVPLSDFDVSLAPGAPPRLLRIRNEPGQPSAWSLRAVDPAPGYAAAVAVEMAEVRLVTWTFVPDEGS